MDERKLWNRKELLSEISLKNEEGRQKKKAKREVTQLLDEKELPDEQQLRKEQKRLNKKELQDEKGPLNRELFKGRRSLEPVGSRTDTVARGNVGVLVG
jgi:hypothetical protein